MRIAKLRLRELKLLAEADPNDIDGLDAHPVVRSYFAHAQLESNSRGYHEAQEFLGTHYANLARKIPHYDVSRDDRKDAERIHHLAMAVYHKCRKGQAEDAFVNIYWEEIQAERRYYLTTERHLGAYALSILANFFAEPWHELRPVGELIGVRILNEAAFCLRGIGRLDEAVQASETALDAAIRLKRHSEYFNAGVNLVNILIVLGRLDQALTLARKLKATYEHLGTGWVNAVVRVRVLATLADCLYQMGKTKKAKTAIANAMKISAQQSPVPMTIANRVSLQIYAGGGNLNEGVARARADLDRLRQERQSDLVAIAFCEMLLAMGLARAGSVAEATSLFDTSVLKFRSSARDDILPYGLLARAAHRRLAFKRSGDAALVHAAGEDLTEVEEIAERGGMRLHLTDFHLECARLHCAQIARGEPVWLPVHLEAQAPGAPRKPSFWASLFGSRHVAQPALEAKPSRLTPRQQDCLRAAEKHLQAGSRLIDDTHYLRREEERAELRKELDRLRGTG